ncbi:hypothetical protein GCM10017602_01120 [Herbiconiux flava]|nr:hypothetical protein GCM10017602_01120 [Herbiconiux flava]
MDMLTGFQAETADVAIRGVSDMRNDGSALAQHIRVLPPEDGVADVIVLTE